MAAATGPNGNLSSSGGPVEFVLVPLAGGQVIYPNVLVNYTAAGLATNATDTSGQRFAGISQGYTYDNSASLAVPPSARALLIVAPSVDNSAPSVVDRKAQ